METKPKSTKMLAILVLALALMVCPKKTTAGVGDIKQLIHDFVVASGESVTAGDVVSSFEGGIQKGFGGGGYGPMGRRPTKGIVRTGVRLLIITTGRIHTSSRPISRA